MIQTRNPELLPDQLDMTAGRFSERLALSHDGLDLSWAEVREESRRLARSLIAAGIRRGDHVAVWLPNQPQWLLIWLAAMHVGAAVVPLNTRYTPAEAAYVLSKSNARLLFLQDEFLGVDYVDRFRTLCPDWTPERAGVSDLPDLDRVVVLGRTVEGLGGFEEFLAAGSKVSLDELAEARSSISVDDTTIIVFTSGTTGFPKGVMHSHRALEHMTTVTRWLEAGPEDRVLGHLPLFHVAGAFSTFLLALIGGGAVVLLDQWDATAALELVQEKRVSILSGIPTHFIDLIRHPRLSDFDTSSLRTGWIGGSVISPEVLEGARSALGMAALLPTYGMTETVSCTTLGRTTDPPESLLAAKGTPLGGYDVSVVDPETRRPVRQGQDGEIAVRGRLVMKGYYEEPEATAAVLDGEGWFYTGDFGAFDDRGYLSITGRKTDKYIVGGNNVHPADVERVLALAPGVRQVQVVAIPDDRLGEVGVAFVEADTPDRVEAELEVALRDYCRENLASFKRPRYIVFTDEWPMTPTAKIQKFQLKKRALEKYAADRSYDRVER